MSTYRGCRLISKRVTTEPYGRVRTAWYFSRLDGLPIPPMWRGGAYSERKVKLLIDRYFESIEATAEVA
jgi:hypothetical protein